MCHVAEPLACSAQGRRAVELGERPANELRAKRVVEPAARREQPLGRVRRGQRPAHATEPGRPHAHGTVGGRPYRPRQARPRARSCRGAVLPVAAQELVGPLAGERDRDVARSELRQREEAERREVREGLVHEPGELLEVDRLLRERQLELVVLRPEVVGDEAGVGELVPLTGLGEADGERLHRLGHVTRHEPDDHARVDATAQHRAERDVAHQPQPHGLVELGEQALGGLLEAHRDGRRHGVGPVRLRARSAAVDDQPVAGQQLADARERRHRARHEPEAEERVDRLVVEVVRHEAAREDALQLGREDQEIAGFRVVERLDAEAVARDHRPPFAPVPDGRAELAAQVLRIPGAVLLVEVRQDLRVAAARERVTASLEAGADVLVVVELAVLDRPDVPVLARDRLVTARDVDDAEPSDAERDALREVRPAVVRAAMRHGVRHAVEDVRRHDGPRLAAHLNDSADSAHGSSHASRRPRAATIVRSTRAAARP